MSILFAIILFLLSFNAYSYSNVISHLEFDETHEISSQTIYQSEIPENGIIDVIFIPNTSLLAFIDASSPIDDGSLLFYDVEKQESIAFLLEVMKAVRVITDSDGSYLFTGNRQGDVTVFATEMRETVTQFSANDAVIEAIDISEDGQHIATASTNSNAYSGIYSFGLFLNTGDVIFQKPSSDGDGLAVTFIDELEQVAYVTNLNGNMGTVNVLDTSSGEYVGGCPNHNHVSRDILYVKSGEYLLYAATDGIRKWDLRDCKVHSDAWSIFAQIPSDEQIWAMTINSTESVLAVGGGKIQNPGNSGVIRLFNLQTGLLIDTIELQSEVTNYTTIYTLAFSPDGTLLASGGADGTVRVWGIPMGED
ncbi:MAG: hypothetical protein MUF38_10235 [Anaerolineae bacterium]|jgi:WD40 repeat protein|nr:hypothetical protein [Anaerolineae bacterium]